jgi:hypothetical protein
MIIPHEKARPHYCPEVSVDANFKTYAYAGSLETLRAKPSTPPSTDQPPSPDETGATPQEPATGDVQS